MTGLLFQFTIFHITHLLFFGFCIHILSRFRKPRHHDHELSFGRMFPEIVRNLGKGSPHGLFELLVSSRDTAAIRSGPNTSANCSRVLTTRKGDS